MNSASFTPPQSAHENSHDHSLLSVYVVPSSCLSIRPMRYAVPSEPERDYELVLGAVDGWHAAGLSAPPAGMGKKPMPGVRDAFRGHALWTLAATTQPVATAHAGTPSATTAQGDAIGCAGRALHDLSLRLPILHGQDAMPHSPGSVGMATRSPAV